MLGAAKGQSHAALDGAARSTLRRRALRARCALGTQHSLRLSRRATHHTPLSFSPHLGAGLLEESLITSLQPM